MTPFESEAWLNQLERRARKRRQDQLVRLVLVIAADVVLVVAIFAGLMWWGGYSVWP